MKETIRERWMTPSHLVWRLILIDGYACAPRSFTPFTQSAYSRTITLHHWCNHVVGTNTWRRSLVIAPMLPFFLNLTIGVIVSIWNNRILMTLSLTFLISIHSLKKKLKKNDVRMLRAISSLNKKWGKELIKEGFFFPINPLLFVKKRNKIQIESLPLVHPTLKDTCFDLLLLYPRRLLIRNWHFSFCLNRKFGWIVSSPLPFFFLVTPNTHVKVNGEGIL